MSRRTRLRLLAGAGLVVALLAGLRGVAALTGEPADWIAVERGDLVIDVEVSGTLEAVDTVLLGPPPLRNSWQFKISYLAPEGEVVEAGSRVLGFDASELQQRLLEAVAERDGARKRVEKVEKELGIEREETRLALAEASARLRKARLKAERPEIVVSIREQEQVRLELELAEKEVAYLEHNLETAERSAAAQLAALTDQLAQAEQTVSATREDIERLELRAPRPGTVLYVRSWRDEKKKVGDACWRGEDVIELPDLSAMKGMGQVHEADAGRLARGQRTTLRLDAHPDVEFAGRVGEIWSTVQRQSWRNPLKVVRLEIVLDETDTTRMRPGMRFRGRIETERIAGALLLPAEAVFLEQDGPVVYRRSWRGTARVPVRLGRRNASRVEVLEGLSEGDRVSAVAPEQDA
jgi:multidrug efflux pump subunit AcrA (membrane-fusion protein)